MIAFGTGGWRAKIGEEFICENVRRIGGAVCAWLKETGKSDRPVVIGYDRRFLSREAAGWLAEMLCGQGFSVLFLHRSAPTPLLMHTVLKQGLHCGLQVTASHNPAIYNGVKLIVEEGRDAPVEITQRIEELANSETLDLTYASFAAAEKEGQIAYIKNPFNDFIDDILAGLDQQAIRKRGLRILFDSMHGSGTYALMVILHTVRCTVDIIHAEKDAYFGGLAPAPEKKTLTELADKVVAGGYDLGIALDGDGDRLGIIDPTGHYVTSNDILAMLYYYLHEYKGWRGPVVRNMSTTHMLDAVAASFGEACHEVPVGFKWISAKIDETDAVLGGESSGGLTVRGHIHGKDSAYAAALFVEMLSVMEKTPLEILSHLTERYGTYVMEESNFSYPPEMKPQLLHLLFEEKQLPAFDRAVQKVSYEDGCKVHFEDGGFIVCRFSGTEPLLRFCAEAENTEKARAAIQAFRDFLSL